MELILFENNYKLAFWFMAVNGKDAWFCDIFYNALFHMNLETYEINLEAFLPKGKLLKFQLYASISYYDGRLVIAPRDGENILIYNLNEKKFDVINLDLSYEWFEDTNLIMSKVDIYKHYAIFFPRRYKAIVKLDLETYKIEYIDNWYKDIKEEIAGLEDGCSVFRTVRKISGSVYALPCRLKNIVLKIDVDNWNYEIEFVGESHLRLIDVLYIDDSIWVSTENETGVICFTNKGERKFKVGEDTFKGNSWYSSYLMGDNVCIVPEYGNRIYKINKSTGEYKIITYSPDEPEEIMKKFNIFHASLMCKEVLNETTLFVYSLYNGKFLMVNIENGATKEIDLVISEKDKMSLKQHIGQYRYNWFAERINSESDSVGINDVVESLAFSCNNDSVHQITECGSKIHEEILKQRCR